MKLIISTLFMLLYAITWSQTTGFTVTGTVTDAGTGSPLQYASVQVKGTRSGTSTLADGSFTIAVPNDKTVLVFSYVGYQTKEVFAGASRIVKVQLLAAARTETEVVVTGFSASRRSMTVGASAASVSGKAKPESLLTGTASGLVLRNIISGKNSIRGIGSMRQITRNDDKFLMYKQAVDELVTEKMHQYPADEKNKPGARLLTAGEWNDLDNWSFWKKLSDGEEAAGFQTQWQQYYQQKLMVKLFNKSYEPVQGLRVVVVGTEKDTLWQSVTDAFGQAVLWPRIQKNNAAQKDDTDKTVTDDEEADSPAAATILVLDEKNRVLQRRATRLAGDENFSFIINRQQDDASQIDVMFMVDATGSMGDEINYLKAELNDIFGRLRLCAGNNLQVRLGQVFYRDVADEYVVRNLGFDSVVTDARAKLALQRADGGGDFEEAVELALDSAIHHKDWNAHARAKLLFMILDAPPHYDSARMAAMRHLYQTAAAKGITLIPVASSGIDKNTEFLMRFGAMATNGTYVFLTDDSGVGDTHLKPTIGKFQVELLNELLLRLILRYSGQFSTMAFR